MRPTVPLAIQLATCPAPAVMATLAGLWNGKLFLAGEEEGTPFSLLQDGCASEGEAVGRLAFTGTEATPAEIQLLEASATTYVALVGPYHDPASNAEMLTVLEARRAGNRLYGTYRARPVRGGRATEGRFVAVRSDLAA